MVARPQHLWILLALVGALYACAPGISPTRAPGPPPSAAEDEWNARVRLEEARRRLADGDYEAAAASAQRGLASVPEEVRLHRLRALALEAQGREPEASVHRRRALELAPPWRAPEEAMADAARLEGLEIWILPLPRAETPADRLPAAWPKGALAARLAARLETRLPGARLRWLDGKVPASVPAVRSWARGSRRILTLRVDRAYCRTTHKDGEIGVVWLRSATTDAGGQPALSLLREVVEDPSFARGSALADCRAEALERALERSLAADAVQETIHTDEPQRALSRRAALALVPSLAANVERERIAARRALAHGDLSTARTRVEAALRMDSEDPDALALQREIEVTEGISRELSNRGTTQEVTDPESDLDPDLSPSQRRVLEARLAAQRRQRSDLLAALEVIDEERAAPSTETVAALRRAESVRSNERGAQLAKMLAGGGPVEARNLYGPGGDVIARYFFGETHAGPLLREVDVDGDGEPDRWIAYRRGLRSEVWRARSGAQGELHLVFQPDGEALVRLELDTRGDGHFDRVLTYASGRVQLDSRDTTGDGHFDHREHFDAQGDLRMREEDVDGDEAIDVRTAYDSGRVVRREILNPEALRLYQ